MIDIDHFRTWIGRTEEATELLAPVIAERFRATLSEHLFATGDAAPIGIHWCLTLPLAAAETLGPDGHPPRGGFLPPVPLASRMWAGGEVCHHGALAVGDLVTRRSTITDVSLKRGRSGDLVFVTVAHGYHVEGRLRIADTQNIVYRDSTPPAAAPADPAGAADMAAHVETGPVLLFRYSALTFNGHRIHYDLPYAQLVEGYSGLVVHGPLQATLLLNLAARLVGRVPVRLRYRGLSPLIAGRAITLHHRATADGGELWVHNADAVRTMEGCYSLA